MPCPACGGLIHPIAGRCKHCRADLVAWRGGGPTTSGGALAPAALPHITTGPAALAPTPPPAQAVVAYLPGASGSNGHAAPSLLAGMSPSPATTISPGYPVGADAEARGSWLARRWPMIVVVLAAIAIAVSVVMLLVPPKPSVAKPARALTPASGGDDDRMPTNPQPTGPGGQGAMPGQVAPDQGGGQGATPPDPADPWSSPPGVPAPTDPDDLAPPMPPVPPDDPVPAPSPGGTPTADRFLERFLGALRDRDQQCGGSNGVVLDQLAQALRALGPGGNGTCYQPARADRCLTAAQQFPCDAMSLDSQQLMRLFAAFPDCTETVMCVLGSVGGGQLFPTP
ncbi:MAG: hypothetical protein KA297_18460 [Kofleriaceae bacterium]|nr:hypothetical protein [Kofleriaceae bacterium]MBP6840711.1 hypothetical protein [Kofleriaceae bacterium]